LIGLDDIPDRSAAQWLEEDSRVVLLMPRYPTLAGRVLGKVLRRSGHIRVKLDEAGSAVWGLIDGNRTVRQIGEEIKGRFGESAEPLYPRLVEFLEILLRNRFVRILERCEVSHVEEG
jgi:hypothetical protein